MNACGHPRPEFPAHAVGSEDPRCALRRMDRVSKRKPRKQSGSPASPTGGAAKSSTRAASSSGRGAGAGALKPPPAVLLGAAIAIIQSIVVIVFGCFLIYRELIQAENQSMVSDSSAANFVGTGTAIFIFIIFGYIIVSSILMVKGKRWGKGGIILVQFILAFSSFQMMSGGAVALGVATLLSALICLYCLMFVPASQQWFQSTYVPLK